MRTKILPKFFLLAVLVFGQNADAQVALSRERSFVHYTDSDGLPFLSVTDFVQDPAGFMWVATRIGICKFDGYNFRTTRVLDQYDQEIVLSSPFFMRHPDGEKIYVRSWDNRIFEYRDELAAFKQCSFPNGQGDKAFLQPADHDTGFWYIENGSVFYLDPEREQEVPLPDHWSFTAGALEDVKCLGITQKAGSLFLLMENSRVLELNNETETIREIKFDDFPPHAIRHLLVEGDKRAIWIGTVPAGAFRLDLQTREVRQFSKTADAPFRITNNLIRDLGEDQDQHVWIATENGLCIWDYRKEEMEYYQYDINYLQGLNSNAVYAIYCDRKGDVWVGTYFGGINLYNAGKSFFKEMVHGIGEGYLSGKQVSCFAEDSLGNMYVGFEGEGINRIDAVSGEVKKICHVPGKNSLSYDNVHAMLFGSDRQLYVATFTGGLNRYDPETGHFQVFNQKNTPQLPSDNIYSLLQQGDSIFVGTDNGLVVYSLRENAILPFYEEIFSGELVHSICRSGNFLWFSTYDEIYKYNLQTRYLTRLNKFRKPVSISFVIPDKEENIWIGDNYHGLRIYWKDLDSIHHYAPDSGFPAKRVYGMLPGEGDYYWLSTNQGLIKFSPNTQNAVVYNRHSGLSFTQFNYQAHFQSRSGIKYFGGVNGLVYFEDNPEFEPRAIEQLVFSDFDLFYRSVDPAGDGPLDKPIHLTDAVRLKYGENVFTIHYSALDFTHPGRVQYAYFLDGFETDWNLVGNKRSASYTNLSPGDYTFYVKASYDNLNWSNQAELRLTVAPPFWRTDVAYMVYGLMVIGGLLAFYLIRLKIENSKTMLALERQEKKHQENINQLKLEFFTNISHELRTPLTLIIGPLSRLLNTENIQFHTREKLEHIYHNAQRLVFLINQLLDFRKTETGQEKLQVRKTDICPFVEKIKEAFEGLAELKEIQFELQLEVPEQQLYFDQEKVERMLFNLLSNAFKFTPEGGKVLLKLKTVGAKKDPAGGGPFLQIKVQDNGKGIAEDQLPHIFHRYYQGDKGENQEAGSGIGLAFVNSLVRLHKGSMQVKSKPGRGSTFNLRIPVIADAYRPQEIGEPEAFRSKLDDWVGAQLTGSRTVETASPDASGKPQILVVDDNPDLLIFLRDSLSEKFEVATAMNGLEALAYLKDQKPELVISDVMMPEMDGLELTKRIKENIETSHLPVILLTAKAELEHHLEGFSSGADFYLEKPFYPELLLKHIENILTTRRRLIELFKKDIYLAPAEIVHSRSDQEFIEKLTKLIEDNIDHPNMDVAFLLREMCVSRSLLHLKLKKILNCSTTEYIRTVRLKNAARLIVTGEKTITEAAYVCGFSSPSLFSRRFKEFFGKSPRAYLKAYTENADTA